MLARADAVAVLETSDCRGRKFFRGRPPRVMHIHEYSNVIERRARVGVEGDGGVLERFDQPSTRFKNDEGQPRERIQIRAAQGPLLLLASRSSWNTEGRPCTLCESRDDTHDTDSYLAKDIAYATQKV